MTTPGSNGPGEQPPGGPAGWGQPGGAPQQPGAVPPPPPGQPGQFPQGQYPPQQGQPGQFPQGHYAPQQGQPGQYPPGQGWAPAPAAKGNNGKLLAIAGAVLAVVVIAVLAFAFLGAGDPEPGDCLREDGQELAIVDCDDSDAAYRLVGIQEGEQSYDEYLADPETCAAFLPESTQSFWVGEDGDTTGQGVVYCVAAV